MYRNVLRSPEATGQTSRVPHGGGREGGSEGGRPGFLGKQQATNGCVQASCKSITTPMPSLMLGGPTNEPLTCIRQEREDQKPPTILLLLPLVVVGSLLPSSLREHASFHRSYDASCFHSCNYNASIDVVELRLGPNFRYRHKWRFVQGYWDIAMNNIRFI